MSDRVAEVFGYLILVTAVVLFAWEFRASKQLDADVKWLHTEKRFKRRVMMALLLVFVGILIVIEARGILVLERVGHLMIYVVSLCFLAITLFVLSIRDLGDMARNAERQALEDLQAAIQEQRKGNVDSGATKE